MKSPKARKLPSGSWFAQVRINGKSTTFTASTKKACEAKALAFKMGLTDNPSDMKLSDAMNRYINDRESVLSPSTIASYRVIYRNRFQDIMGFRLSDITSQVWQRSVNREAKQVSAKTLKNSAALVQTVIKEFCGTQLNARLPQVVNADLPWLQPDQVKVFLKTIEGNKYELPILLAMSGLRHSELIAVRYSDIDIENQTIRVSGSAVKNEHGELIDRQENKNKTSNRTIPIMIQRISDIVEEHGVTDEYIYHKYDNVLRININKVCKYLGYPEIGVHGCRRSWVSVLYNAGVTESQCMRLGGWSTPDVMRKVYIKLSEAENLKAEQKIKEFFSAN